MTAQPDQSDFVEVFNATKDGVYRLFFKLTRDNVQTEDLVQECYMRLWEKWALAEDPNAYVYGIAFHLAKGYIRKKVKDMLQAMDALPEVEDPDKVDSLYEFKETKERLYAIIRELSPEKAAAFTLIKEEALSYKEASQILGVPVSTLEKQVSGSLKQLRKALVVLILLTT